MPLVTDPDDLSQGTLNNVADLAFTASASNATTITGSATLPALADDEWFEIRGAAIPGNNGLYRVADATPTTSSIDVEKFTGPNPTDDTAESTDILGTTGAGSEKSVMFDCDASEFYILEQGNVDADGVTQLAFHSFAKEEWKSDALLIAACAFPITGISFAAGQWIFGQDPSGNNSGWKPAEDITAESQRTRSLIRNAGWDEIDANGFTRRSYFNATTLGDFEDETPLTGDNAYYWFGDDPTDTGAAVDYEFTGPVNEAVLYFEEFQGEAYTTLAFATSSTITRAAGSFITNGYQVGSQVTIRNAEDAGNNGTFVLTAVAATTLTVSGTPFTTNADDTTAVLAVDHSNAFNTALRVRDADPTGKTFSQSDLAGAGETAISSKIIKFPLANASDPNITETDANIDANTPYTEIRPRYLATTYNREVDSTTKRDFGIVIDVGTYSQADGASAASTLFTSASLNLGTGEALADYTGGSLIIHEGTDQGTHTIVGTPVDNAGTLEITLSVALTATESNLSFTMERATPLTASANEILEKINRELRQDADIDQTAGVVTGRTADELISFIAATDVRFGSGAPNNPNGGGSGVIVEGFDSNDTNSYSFFDNGGTSRTFPFVAAGNLLFNQGLVDDSDGEYWLFFEYTTRTNLTDAAVVSPSGDTYDLESPGSNLPALSVNDYIFIPAGGFADEASNGLFIVTAVNVSTSDYTIRKVDGSAVGAAESGVTIDVDENPYPSPDGILVDDNSGTDIAGPVGSTSIAFDFDYDNNVQGGRASGTDAAVVLIAAGLETAQVAVVKGLTITRSTGLSFSITAAQERNYENAA